MIHSLPAVLQSIASTLEASVQGGESIASAPPPARSAGGFGPVRGASRCVVAAAQRMRSLAHDAENYDFEKTISQP
jgi:hypothetical protein